MELQIWEMGLYLKKSWIQETMNLLTDADSSTDTILFFYCLSVCVCVCVCVNVYLFYLHEDDGPGIL